jgi:hypothetical protein
MPESQLGVPLIISSLGSMGWVAPHRAWSRDRRIAKVVNHGPVGGRRNSTSSCGVSCQDGHQALYDGIGRMCSLPAGEASGR